MINHPNLLFNIDIEDVYSQKEIIDQLFGQDLSLEEFMDKIFMAQDIIMIFDIMGLGYDIEKLKMIARSLASMDRELRDLRGRFFDGSLFKGLSPTKINHRDFLDFLMNCAVKQHYDDLEKKIGKRDFKKYMKEIDDD